MGNKYAALPAPPEISAYLDLQITRLHLSATVSIFTNEPGKSRCCIRRQETRASCRAIFTARFSCAPSIHQSESRTRAANREGGRAGNKNTQRVIIQRQHRPSPFTGEGEEEGAGSLESTCTLEKSLDRAPRAAGLPSATPARSRKSRRARWSSERASERAVRASTRIPACPSSHHG